MDFKKAYEAALERAKGIYNEKSSSSTAKFVCGQIFPEIKESEDERIRKDIIVYLSNELNNVKQLTPRTNEFEAWISYLEKQNAEFLEYGRQEYFRGRTEAIDEQHPAELSDAERKKLYSDGFDIARKALAGTFMQYLDEHRPEGKMCLSNGECAQLDNAFKVGDVETIVRYIIKYQQPAKWSKEDELLLKNAILAAEREWGADSCTADWLKSLRPTWKPSEGRQPSKPQLAEGVYYIKDSQPVAEYEDGVEIDRLLVIGRYCRFYLSMKDLGIANYKEAQNKAASLGEGWRCPDSFEGRTIGKVSKEIREKAAKIGVEHFKEKGWFWTNELYDRWNACDVYFNDGNVYYFNMDFDFYVLALSAFQN